MIELPRLAIITPNRRSWRARRATAPHFRDVLNYVGQSALKRLQRKLCWPDVKPFGSAVELVLIYLLQDAAAILSTGRDIRTADAGRQLLARAAERLEASRGYIGQELRNAAPAIRKAIIAAAFAWLRVQFPALNAVSAVAAARLIQSLLENRKAR
jgi:hypothetical protein